MGSRSTLYELLFKVCNESGARVCVFKIIVMTSGPKIVLIETRYVETDATNFRDVVQRLTGKNSSTATDNASDRNKLGAENGAHSAKPPPQAATDGKKNSAISSMLLMNLSFKDFEALLSDLPSMEDLLL
ncbi:hypothetical protein RJT34_03854 [Clitoria ternatea]|uniref:VQ domain-containing protein n=1 Tax=Clitoria ternatea TaxID=43366 RepID=A0AAN9KKJ4_CLITE